MKTIMKFAIVVLLVAVLLVGMTFVLGEMKWTEKNRSVNAETHGIQYSESVNKDLGPYPETYRQDFPVEEGANRIEVRLLVSEFDYDDYGKICLTLYDNNNQLVATDISHLPEKYLNVLYNGNISPGKWYITISVMDDLGTNTINVAGNINVFGGAANSTVKQ